MRRPSSWCGAAKLLVGCVLAAGATGCGGPEVKAIAIEEGDGSLSIAVGTFDRTCDEAHSILFKCGCWELYVSLDPEAQSGKHPLASDSTYAESFVSDGEYDGDSCSILGGTFEQGSIEITEVDGSHVKFTISGTAVGSFDADGSYDATVCP